MTENEKNRDLVRRFPFLLPRNVWTDILPDDYDYSYTLLDNMPDGWRKAFGEQICEEIMAELESAGMVDEYRIFQIKEKYGELRWYDNGFTRHGFDIIGRYTDLSRRTCIRCGAPATRVTTGWISPYCDACCPSVHSVPIDEEETDDA